MLDEKSKYIMIMWCVGTVLNVAPAISRAAWYECRLKLNWISSANFFKCGLRLLYIWDVGTNVGYYYLNGIVIVWKITSYSIWTNAKKAPRKQINNDCLSWWQRIRSRAGWTGHERREQENFTLLAAVWSFHYESSLREKTVPTRFTSIAFHAIDMPYTAD